MNLSTDFQAYCYCFEIYIHLSFYWLITIVNYCVCYHCTQPKETKDVCRFVLTFPMDIRLITNKRKFPIYFTHLTIVLHRCLWNYNWTSEISVFSQFSPNDSVFDIRICFHILIFGLTAEWLWYREHPTQHSFKLIYSWHKISSSQIEMSEMVWMISAETSRIIVSDFWGEFFG